MAVTNLRLIFTGNADRRVTFNYPNANASVPAAQVRTLMQRIVANNDIFAEQPLAMESATFITTASVPVDIS